MDQRIIGLTGGIATGKTTVANYLAESYHLPILDADIYARDAITPNLLDVLQKRYGLAILDFEAGGGDRFLNRKKLGEIIFSNPKEKVWLESHIHPYVRDRLQTESQIYSPNPVVMVVPLLFETGIQDLVTETWVVSCNPELELQRLMHRDQLDQQSAQLRINSQMPMTQKVAIADFVLDNSNSLDELFQQVDKLMNPTC